MARPAPELSSLTTTLEEVTAKVTALADRCLAEKQEELAAELYGAEAALVGVVRRLRRALDNRP